MLNSTHLNYVRIYYYLLTSTTELTYSTNFGRSLPSLFVENALRRSAQELDDDDNTLGYFGVCDGSEIFMNEVDLKGIELKKKQEEDEEKAKNAEEEERASRMITAKKTTLK